jgi:hypothetical protein
MFADCRQHFAGITACGNDGMSGSERRFGDVYTQSTACTGDKPNFFLSHVIVPFLTSAATDVVFVEEGRGKKFRRAITNRK